jgi:hypothetical protein
VRKSTTGSAIIASRAGTIITHYHRIPSRRCVERDNLKSGGRAGISSRPRR